MQISMQQLATIHTPFKTLANMPVQPCGAKESIATIEFKKIYQDGLKDLDGFSHVYLIYYFHKVQNHQLEVVPFNDKTNTQRGVFSTRTPKHPNSIGISLVELVKVKNNIVYVKGVDILDNTPLLDIKPYIPEFDQTCTTIRTGWMHSSAKEVAKVRSDNRFC